MGKEVIINLPEGIEDEEIDAAMLNEALEALQAKKVAQARARDRREKMTEEEKAEAARAAKMRRAKIALQVKYAEDNGYLPSKDEINAYLAAQ